MPHYPEPLADAIRRELGGETVLWTDSPVAESYRRRNWVGLPAVIVLLLLAGGSFLLTPFLGCSFAALALVTFDAAGTPYFRKADNRRLDSICYVITQQRVVLFARSEGMLRIHSFDADSVESFEKFPAKGNSGDLLLYMRIGSGARPPGFLNLEDLAPAEAALRQILPSRGAAPIVIR